MPCPYGRELYEVSSEGRVRSWNNNRWGRRPEPIILSERTDEWGYKRVNLGRGVVKLVSRLVCEAFHGAPFEGAEAAHGDGDKANNRAANLRWATPTENAADRFAHGTNSGARLTEAQVLEIRRRRRSGERNMDLAAEFGVKPMHISNLTSGKKWRHLPMEV